MNIESEKARLLALATSAVRRYKQFSEVQLLSVIEDFAALVRAMELRPDQRIVTVEQLKRAQIHVPYLGETWQMLEAAIIGEKK